LGSSASRERAGSNDIAPLQRLAGLRLTPIGPHRAHEYVADQLRREITLGLTAQLLPAERELARIFGVGRATVQAAIGILESEGLVQTKRGRGGGIFVIGSPPSPNSKHLVIERLRNEKKAIADAVMFRTEIEPTAAAWAAKERGVEELTVLQDLLAVASKTTDDAEFTRLDSRFHMQVVYAAHNSFLADAIERARLAVNPAILMLPETELWQQKSLQEHMLILAAIKAGNGNRSRLAMHRHVASTARSVLALLETI
jgi:GntR family transcriptional repressor for pyruvate dehydrogenase complex